MKELFFEVGETITSDCGLYTITRMPEGWVYRYAPHFDFEIFVPTAQHVHEMILKQLQKNPDLLNQNTMLNRKIEYQSKPLDLTKINNHLKRIENEIRKRQ